jgi:hypothetical protein
MSFRLSRTLKICVECECRHQDLAKASDKEVAKILVRLERCGDAIRAVDRRGRLIWKASPTLVARLAEAEQEVDDEYESEKPT